MNIYDVLLKNAEYAIASLSRDLVYEAYGAAKCAWALDAITKEQFYNLNDILVVKGLNNYKEVKLK